MRNFLAHFVLIFGFLWVAPAEATVRIDIDLTNQRMNVESSTGNYSWPVSTARSGYVTPHGSFKPYRLQLMHYSRKYHMSPMPYSIFFAGGYAIHGTYERSQIGRPASHGCIRLDPDNAALLFEMVKAEGATITISGTPPRSHFYASSHSHYRRFYARARYGPEMMQQWLFDAFGR